MKVLLLKDVYKLGHAGDVKKVADGYGRNFLLTQGFAVLATPGAMKTVEKIREKAAVERAVLNKEMSGLAEQINGVELQFVTKAGETGKLYGSITNQMVIDELNKRLGTTLDRHQVEVEPIRTLGEHPATIRLTVDLNPKVNVIVVREGEAGKAALKKEKKETAVEAVAPVIEKASIETEEKEIDVPEEEITELIVEETADETVLEDAAE